MKILLVEDNPGDARLLLEELKEEGRGSFELHWVESLHAALEKLAQHPYDSSTAPFDAMLLDLNLTDSHGLDTFAAIHSRSPQLPIVLLTGMEDEGLGLRAVQEGAQDFLIKGQTSGSSLARALRYAVERNRSLQWHRSKSRHTPGGRTIAFLGAKGGVGATTVALNAAASLAHDRLVIAAELTGGYGSFSSHFRKATGTPLPELLSQPAAAIVQGNIERFLVNSQLGFYLLLGPQNPDQIYTPEPNAVGRLVDELQTMADYAILDLPAAWGPAHVTALKKANTIVVVAERDDASLAAARFTAERLRKNAISHDALHLAVVNRSPSVESLAKEKIEEITGLRVLGIVPPAPDICLGAQRAGTPVSVFRPRSAPAGILTAIAQAAASAATPAAAVPAA